MHSQPTDILTETPDVNEEAILNVPTITLIQKKPAQLDLIHIAELGAIINYCFKPLTFCVVCFSGISIFCWIF